MIAPAELASLAASGPAAALPWPLPLAGLVPLARAWELEIGFGKGRYLLARAAAEPERGFVGIEVAGEYFRAAARRAARRRLGNLVLLRGEALYLLATALPPAFAEAVHVYFPDPWPKAHHQRRRLLSPAALDLVTRALAPGGRILFATDHAGYGAEVEELLAGARGLAVRRWPGGWPGGPRTNYEAKYVAEGRPILRLELELADARARAPHPRGLAALAVAPVPAPASEPAPAAG
ncbi:MAG: hypothetical protein M5U13_10195 [Thermoanaerobaculia bacterium]|nr:hypothetical protein [Thermoanaerobaculia bacterium]